MRRPASIIAALFLLGACEPASAQQAALNLELNVKNYFKIREAIASPKDESGWREIPWRPSLGEALIEARKADKPVLLWVMNGHPCGMT